MQGNTDHKWTTVEYESEYDEDLNTEISVLTDDDTEDSKPPQELADAVHTVLKDTIANLMDGRSVKWKKNDRGWLLVFCEMLPEMPTTQGGEIGFLPPYRTAEKFEGMDGSGEGLHENLPGNWGYEVERKGTYIFYTK